MDDIPRDEHLRTALRHAPDAGLAAPADISAQILAAAHRAAAERAPAAAPPRQRGWRLNAPWRLGASGAFATLLLAGIVGLIWHGETPGPATDAAAEAATTAPAPAPAAAPAAAVPAPAAAQAPAAGPARAAARAPAAVPTPVAVPAHTSVPIPAAAPVPAAAPAPMAGAAPPAAAPAADAVKPAPPPKTVLGRQDADARSEAGPPRQREPAAKEEKDMAREESRRLAQAMEEAGRVEGRVIANGLQPAPSSPAPAPTPAAEPAAAARKPMADAAGVETRGRAAPAPALMAAPRPTGPWMDALAAGPAVQWTVNGEARAPTSSWLYALAVQTQGRWRPAPNAQPLAGEQVVSWKRGDEALGRLWLGADRVLWCDAAGRCEEAALAPDVALALGKGLAR